jgi:hypothetical protein
MLSVTDHEAAPRCFHDLTGDRVEAVEVGPD